MCVIDKIKLASGRETTANLGIFGISPSGEMYEGYDGVFDAYTNDGERLTYGDMVEICEMMIVRWKAARDKFLLHDADSTVTDPWDE